MIVRVVAVVLALTGPALANQPKAFEKFAPEKGEFTVEMPGTPADKVVKKDGQVVYTLISGTGVYQVSYFDLPATVDLKGKKPHDVIKAFRDGYRGGQKFDQDRELELGKDKIPGREYRMAFDKNVHVRERMYLSGTRFYMLFVGSGDEKVLDTKDANRFFDSFTIGK